MQGYGFSLTSIFPCMDRIYDSVVTRENTRQRKPKISQILPNGIVTFVKNVRSALLIWFSSIDSEQAWFHVDRGRKLNVLCTFNLRPVSTGLPCPSLMEWVRRLLWEYEIAMINPIKVSVLNGEPHIHGENHILKSINYTLKIKTTIIFTGGLKYATEKKSLLFLILMWN